MEWQKRWGQEIAKTPTRPGIWRRKSGGFLLACRVPDRKGKRRWLQATLPDVKSVVEAQRELDALRADGLARFQGTAKQQTRWSAYAESLYERKISNGDLNSAKTRERWDTTLRLHLVPAFGGFWCHELNHAHIEAWKAETAPRFKLPTHIMVPDKRDPEGKRMRRARNPLRYSPSTANGWLSILGVITKAMTAELNLLRDPMIAIAPFDTSTVRTYTAEAPNSLGPGQAGGFLETWEKLFPQHYPFVLLGSVTGLRPSSLRPMRRKGPSADVLWGEGAILVRRSHSLGQEVMDRTKTKKDQTVYPPASTMARLKVHADALDASEDERIRDSELLFPALDGKFRARSSLDKPFRAVAEAMGLPYTLSPRAMRRTFNDLARAARVSDVVTRSISGHSTEAMQVHYSTARADEQRAAMSQILEVFGGSNPPTKAGIGAGANLTPLEDDTNDS